MLTGSGVYRYAIQCWFYSKGFCGWRGGWLWWSITEHDQYPLRLNGVLRLCRIHDDVFSNTRWYSKPLGQIQNNNFRSLCRPPVIPPNRIMCLYHLVFYYIGFKIVWIIKWFKSLYMNDFEWLESPYTKDIEWFESPYIKDFKWFQTI